MRRLPIALLLVSLLTPRLILAGSNYDSKVAVHVLPHDPHRTCASGMPSVILCTDIATTYEGCGDMDVFPVFYDVSEYLGVEYALDWPGSESCAFTPCSALHIGGITWPGDGISQVWTECKPGPTAEPGWGWIHTADPGLVTVLPHPFTGKVLILDCSDGVDQPAYGASAGVCGTPGDNPCEGTSGAVMTLDVYDTAGDACVLAGRYVTYTVVYENTSNIKVIQSAVLKNTLPDEAAFISATAGGAYTAYTHIVKWVLGDLPPGRRDSVDATVRILIDAPPDIDIVDRCLAYESQTAIAVAEETTSVCPDAFAPMDLTKDDGLGGAGIAAGDTIAYTISYGNTANDVTMHNVVLKDVLSPRATFRRASAGGVYTPGNRNVTWDLGSVNAGEQGAVQLVVETSFNLDYGIVITNTCDIVSDEIRPVQAKENTRVNTVRGLFAGLHVLPYKGDRSCAGIESEIRTCRDIKTEIEGCGFVHVFPVFIDIPECRSISYRLIWPEEWSDMAFTSCSDITVGEMVRPWDEITHSWSVCKSGDLVITGWGQVFARGPGRVELAPPELIQLTTCDGRTLSTATHFGCGVCGAPGDDPPCGGGPTNTVPTTWGAIKSMFR